jgi:hypothetical protein
MKWRIYYGDGSTFSSVDGGPSDAPPDNVVCIAYADDPKRPDSIGRAVVNTWDWYIYRKDVNEWWGVDLQGLVDQMKHCFDDVGAVVQGRCVPNDDYNRIVSTAKTDEGLPKRSGNRNREKAGQTYGAGKTE